jgi:hypothetical protein
MNKDKRLIWGAIFGTTLFWLFANFATVGVLKHKGYHLVASSPEPDVTRLEGVDLWQRLRRPEYIAKASMTQDGSVINVNLRRIDLGFKNWNTYHPYKKEDPMFGEIVNRVGGLQPGETKDLKPPPDKQDPPALPATMP